MAINVGKKHRNIDYNTKILEVKNLKKHFTVGVGKSKLIVPAVDDISLDIYKREVFGLVGESGCGKTTTGRTIIKLYNPTAGTVKLNDIQIGAGDQEHIDRIKEIKAKLEYDNIQLDEAKRLIYEINQKRDQELMELDYKIQASKANYKTEVSKLEEPIQIYRNEKYLLSEKYKLDIENTKYTYILKRDNINKLRVNQVEQLYKNELDIEKNKYRNKLSGLKESAALVKEDKEQRINDLKKEYAENVQALDDHFIPLIENGKKDIITSAESSQRLKELRSVRDQKIHEIKEQHTKDLEALVEPNYESIKETLSALKIEHDLELKSLKDEIRNCKQKAAEEVKAIPKTVYTPEEKEAQDLQIKELSLKANEQIRQEKANIISARRINKSKEALLMSQKMQMIFQDPISSLNPRMTVKEIVGEGLIIQGKHTNLQITKMVEDVLELVGLSKEHAMRYPHEFSGGQRQRIGVARALIMEPNFIIADEPISALDVSIQAQVINLLQDLKSKLDLTILFIAHDLSVVRFFCDRIAVMYNGKIMEMAESEELFKHPLHPYTKSLLSAIPVPDPDYEKDRKRIDYNPRIHDYRYDKPSLREIREGHYVYANNKEFEALIKEYEKQEKEGR